MPRAQGAQPDVALLPTGLLSEVRDPSRTVDAQVRIYNAGPAPVRVRALSVRGTAGRRLAEVPLDVVLAGDGGALRRLTERIAALGLENRCLHEARGATRAVLGELAREVAAIRAARPPSFVDVAFRLPLARTFGAGDRPGEVRRITLSARIVHDGVEDEVEAEHSIRLLEPFRRLALPPVGPLSGAVRFVACDLHVHHCRDEALGGCPNCTAESQNISASFTLAQLKTQFQALGVDAFTSTSHSYCINSATAPPSTRASRRRPQR